MTIGEIKDILKANEVEEAVLENFLTDPRKGVQDALQSYFRRVERENRERLRVENLYEPEATFYAEGQYHIVGIDEVGRGPLAGPVTVAAVILRPHDFFNGLNDSKKVIPKRREELAQEIKERAVAVSIVSLPPEEIDSLNIYQATLMAMYQAVKALSVCPEGVLVDAMPLRFPVKTISLVHGDTKSASVAAASIVAKVHRDHLMEVYDKEYPGYGFAQNKGYGTAEHMEALRRLGVSPIHRKSFEPVKSMIVTR